MSASIPRRRSGNRRECWDDRLKEHGIEATGGACTCLLKDGNDIQWPRRLGDAYFDIPANPYKCWLAEKVGGVWKFPLQ